MQPESLLASWRLYMRDIKSPLQFIDMAFYSMIAAALQRKVWMQNTEMPLFCNMYVILVGPAGTGKGLALKPVSDIVRYHKLYNKREKEITEAIARESGEGNEKKLQILRELKAELDVEKARKGDTFEEPLLIPITADATTYEKLTNTHSRSISRCNTTEACKFAPNKIYTHSSLTAIIPEVSSLFSKNSEKVVEYLLAAYDCLEEYKYETLKRGMDRVRRGYLNLVGGTTVSFLQESFRDKLLRDGFSSRCIFVYEQKSRFEIWEPKFDEEQLQAKERLIAHVYELAGLFGEIQYTNEARNYLKNLIEKVWPTSPRLNNDPALDDYYARKDIHIKKLSANVHFSKTPVTMQITLEDAQEAVAILAKLEVNMHKALTFEGKNIFSSLQKSIVRYLFRLRNDGASFKDIWLQFEKDASAEQLKTIMQELEDMGVIKRSAREGETVMRFFPLKEL